MGERPKYTWDEAGFKWLIDTEHKRTHRDDMMKLTWLQQFLRGRVLSEITRDDIAAIGAQKKTEASGPTANRYLALIRSILRKACLEWEWIDKVPKVKMYRESRRRVRWITPEQVKTLLAELPVHQRHHPVRARHGPASSQRDRLDMGKGGLGPPNWLGGRCRRQGR